MFGATLKVKPRSVSGISITIWYFELNSGPVHSTENQDATRCFTTLIWPNVFDVMQFNLCYCCWCCYPSIVFFLFRTFSFSIYVVHKNYMCMMLLSYFSLHFFHFIFQCKFCLFLFFPFFLNFFYVFVFVWFVPAPGIQLKKLNTKHAHIKKVTRKCFVHHAFHTESTVYKMNTLCIGLECTSLQKNLFGNILHIQRMQQIAPTRVWRGRINGNMYTISTTVEAKNKTFSMEA